MAMWALASQADVSIVSVDRGLDKIIVGPVVGTFSVRDALQRLLKGGFIVAVRDSRTYEVRRAPVIQGPTLPATAPDSVKDASSRGAIGQQSWLSHRRDALPSNGRSGTQCVAQASANVVAAQISILHSSSQILALQLQP